MLSVTFAILVIALIAPSQPDSLISNGPDMPMVSAWLILPAGEVDGWA